MRRSGPTRSGSTVALLSASTTNWRRHEVILSGVGGDELFGGYRRYLGEHYLRSYQRLPRLMRRSAAGLAQWLPAARHRRWLNEMRLARQFLASADQPPAARYASYVCTFADDEVDALLLQPAHERFDPIASAYAECDSVDPLARMFAVDANTQLPDDLLALTDKMTMAASLECRVPLLDHELVELAARIPGRIKMRGGELKSLLKVALADVLPTDVLQRAKRGFGAPMGAWLKGALAPLVATTLSRSAIEARGLLRPQPVEQLIAAHRANRIDGTDRLLALLALEIWCRIYLDRRSVADVGGQLAERAA
jgi:asparagine synthase (glutamine-hydrolysing)